MKRYLAKMLRCAANKLDPEEDAGLVVLVNPSASATNSAGHFYWQEVGRR